MKTYLTSIFMALLIATLVTACGSGDSLEAIHDSGKLTIISRNSPLTYYQDKNGPSGFDYTLALLFAKRLGVELDIRTAYSINEIADQLKRRDVDIAAAGLTVAGAAVYELDSSIPYINSVSQVIYRSGTFRARTLADLKNHRIGIASNSPEAQLLDKLQTQADIPLSIEEVGEYDTTELLQQVRDQKISFAVLDSNDFDLQQSLFPRLRVAFELGGVQEHSWWLPSGRKHESLKAEIDAFFTDLKNNGTLTQLREQFFGHNEDISPIDSHTFNRAVTKKLPKYQDMIEAVATEYQVDWRLLASISYQESHWNPRAKSPTGVRGMMMLTRPTAKEMGVKNRLNPLQSLRGGVRYLNSLKRRLSDKIAPEDRIWFALAAYNIGLGHVRDARILTDRQGGNPNLWVDVEKRLPLLTQKKYYATLKHGYARGHEPVTYVQNIRHYYNILKWQELKESQPLPPVDAKKLLPDALQNIPLQAL